MSDISASQEAGTATTEGSETLPTVSDLPQYDPSEYEGATEEVVESAEGETSATPPSFDWSTHQDDLVTISVDGEDVQVSMAEAMKGYSRQADYTRKTQELAKQREEVATAAALKQALDVDPQRTLAALKALYGEDEAQAIVAEVEDPDADPLVARVQKFESYMEQQERVAQQNSLIAEAEGAIGKAGLADVDAAGLLAYATENMVGRLDVAARLMKSERKVEVADTHKADVVEAKRRAAIVEGGSGRAPGSVAEPPATNLADAFARAKKQLGIA